MNWAPGFAYWNFALVFIALVLFAVPEYLAKRNKGITFSRFMAYMSRESRFGPLWTGLWWLLFGVLATHFSGWCIPPCLGE